MTVKQVRYECCAHCLWQGRLTDAGKVRKHRKMTQHSAPAQDPTEPVCTGTGLDPHTWFTS